MTPTELNRLMTGVWTKHPETQPDRLRGSPLVRGMFLDDAIDVATAIQLCESSLVRWLANTGDRKPLEIRIGSGGIDVRGPLQERWFVAQTLLEALVSAAMSLPSLTIEQKG
jgi:hypothetical protein